MSSNTEQTITTNASGDLLGILVAQGALDEAQADLVRRRVRRAQIPAYQAILDLALASEEAVFRALAQSHGLPFTELPEGEV